MDGTLVNTEPYWLKAETALMAKFGHEWTSEDQAHCLGGPLPRVGAYMHNLAQVQSPEFFVTELVRGVEEEFHRGIDFMPGAESLMREIFSLGIPLALVSASPRNLVDATLHSLDENIFATSVSSNDVQLSKPDPESYLLAAKRLGVNIENVLILEDSRPGIASAQRSGALVVAIPHLISVDEHPRTVILTSLVDSTLEALTDLLDERITQ